MTPKRKQIIQWAAIPGGIIIFLTIITLVFSCWGTIRDSWDSYFNNKVSEQVKNDLELIRSDIVYIKLLLENHCIAQTGDSSEIVKTKKIMTYFNDRN